MEENLKTVVVAGPGYMGEIEAMLWQEISGTYGLKVGTIVDSSHRRAGLSTKLGSSLVIPPEVFRGDSISLNFAKQIRELAKGTEIWNLAVPNVLHYPYLRLILGAGVNRVFLEKPSTTDPEKSRKISKMYPGAMIQVNYVERGHPVVLAIKDAMLAENFQPTNMFNWRSHDIRKINPERVRAGDLTKITISDSVHDVSEVDFLVQATTPDNIGLRNGFPRLINPKMTSWQEKYADQYPWQSDVSADFTIRFSNGVEARIKGDADFDYRRYFVAWNDDVAFFGQTLSRPNLGIDPVAARIAGHHNVQTFLRAFETGNLGHNSDFRNLFKQTNAAIIDTSEYEPNAIRLMLSNLVTASNPSQLISSLDSAIIIEEVVKDVYEQTGNGHVLTMSIK